MRKSKTECRLAYSLVLSLSVIICICATAFTQEQQELKGDHFIVYFGEDKKFAQDVLNKAEIYYQRIASDLGYPRYTSFWTWDNRVKIYIYPDHKSFLKATDQPNWSQGMADYRHKEIISYAFSTNFLESLLPHEIAHLIFRDFVGFKGEVPLWLDEGVAQWAEKAKKQDIKAMAKLLYEKDTIIPLDVMMKMDVRKMTELDKVFIHTTHTKDGETGVLFLGGENLVNVFYLQAVSLVDYLIDTYGSLSFADFCRQLRDAKTVNEALKAAYPMHITDIEELESKWRRYLEEQSTKKTK